MHYGYLLFVLDLPLGRLAEEVLQWPCRLARDCGQSSHPLSMCRGNINSGAHQFLLAWRVSSAPVELSWFPSLLYAVSPVCCAEAVQLALSCLSNCSKHRCTFDVLLGEGELSIFLCQHLDTLPYQLIFKLQLSFLIISSPYIFCGLLGFSCFKYPSSYPPLTLDPVYRML